MSANVVENVQYLAHLNKIKAFYVTLLNLALNGEDITTQSLTRDREVLDNCFERTVFDDVVKEIDELRQLAFKTHANNVCRKDRKVESFYFL